MFRYKGIPPAIVVAIFMINWAALTPTLSFAQSESGAPTAAQMQQLVAPIALYPDPLVGQILAAATYPTQIVEAARFLQSNPGLSGTQLNSAVDKQSWDPSVKALTGFPSVLNNMNNNLSWTSALGDAYYNDPQDVMKAIQTLRRQAKAAGNLSSNKQQVIAEEGSTIIIQPANPQVIYVPQYNPTVIYGAPVQTYPGYSASDMMMASMLSFGAGVAVGALIGGSSGWNSWGCNWSHNTVIYNNNVWHTGSTTVWNNHNWNNWNHPNGWNNWNHADNWNRDNNWNRQGNWGKDTSWSKSNGQLSKNTTWNNGASKDTSWSKNNGSFNKNTSYDNGALNKSTSWSKNANGGFSKDSSWNSDRGWGGQSHAGSGVFGGYKSGGDAFANSSRGRSSFGGFRRR